MSAATGRFRRSDRLRDARDYRRVMRQGRRTARRDLVVIRAVQPELSSPRGSSASATGSGSQESSSAATSSRPIGPVSARLGITASRKSGNAVRRNHFKRRVREWFRSHRTEIQPAEDIVVIARRSGTELNRREIEAVLCSIFKLVPDLPDVNSQDDRGTSAEKPRGSDRSASATKVVSHGE